MNGKFVQAAKAKREGRKIREADVGVKQRREAERVAKVIEQMSKKA